MGIEGFNQYVVKNFPAAFVKIPPQRNGPLLFDHIVIDLNGVLHTVARKVADEAKFFKFVFRELDFLFRDHARPTESVFIAVDGPGA